MRIMLKVNFQLERANELALEGTLGSTIESILKEMNAEAAYFAEERGARTAYVFVNLKDSSEIPKYAEPWFLALNARVEFHPAMNLTDLQAAAPQIGSAAKRFSKGN